MSRDIHAAPSLPRQPTAGAIGACAAYIRLCRDGGRACAPVCGTTASCVCMARQPRTREASSLSPPLSHRRALAHSRAESRLDLGQQLLQAGAHALAILVGEQQRAVHVLQGVVQAAPSGGGGGRGRDAGGRGEGARRVNVGPRPLERQGAAHTRYNAPPTTPVLMHSGVPAVGNTYSRRTC